MTDEIQIFQLKMRNQPLRIIFSVNSSLKLGRIYYYISDDGKQNPDKFNLAGRTIESGDVVEIDFMRDAWNGLIKLPLVWEPTDAEEIPFAPFRKPTK